MIRIRRIRHVDGRPVMHGRFEFGGREAELTIDEVAYDQAGVPTILGWHRATTAAHAYVNEVR